MFVLCSVVYKVCVPVWFRLTFVMPIWKFISDISYLGAHFLPVQTLGTIIMVFLKESHLENSDFLIMAKLPMEKRNPLGVLNYFLPSKMGKFGLPLTMGIF